MQEIIDDLTKAMNGQFDLIRDPDISNGIDIAFVTTSGITYYDQNGENIIATTSLEEFKTQAIAWKDFLQTPPYDGNS